MATASAVKITPPYTPELLPSVQGTLQTFLEGIKVARGYRPYVLEFGSGWSTIWFARLGCMVVSIEHDQRWYQEVNEALAEQGLSGSVFLREPGSMHTFLSRNPTPIYDVVLIDCLDEERLTCLEASIPFLAPGGLMVVDDTHWDILKPCFSILKGWKRTTLEGFHTRKLPAPNSLPSKPEVCYHQTTLFLKPS